MKGANNREGAPRGKRKATQAEGFIPNASGTAGVAPRNFSPKPSGQAPLTDTTSTGSGNPRSAPVLAAPPKRPESCPVPQTGIAAGSGNACEQGPRNPRTQYDCRGNTQTPKGEPACAAWKLRDPAQINMSVQEAFGGGLVVRMAGSALSAAGARLCKQWCDKVKSAVRGVVNRFIPNAAKETSVVLARDRDRLLHAARDPRLRDAIDELYRPNAKIGSGSSMDAYRFEQRTGILLSRTGHGKKLHDRRRQLQRIFRRLEGDDRRIARDLLTDIQGALGGP